METGLGGGREGVTTVEEMQMILIINEFEDVSQVADLTPDISEAIEGGIMSAFRWSPEHGRFEEYDGMEWSSVEES